MNEQTEIVKNEVEEKRKQDAENIEKLKKKIQVCI